MRPAQHSNLRYATVPAAKPIPYPYKCWQIPNRRVWL